MGLHMKKIQEWLGHSTPITTETIYAHLNVKQKFSFQVFGVVSHRRNLLEIALKAKPPIFPVLSSVFLCFLSNICKFANADQTALPAIWSVAYLNEITAKPGDIYCAIHYR